MLNNIVLATTNVCVVEGEKVSHLLYEWKLVEYLFIIVTEKKSNKQRKVKICINVYVDEAYTEHESFLGKFIFH